jgi:energy-coupling factor transport system permease protein
MKQPWVWVAWLGTVLVMLSITRNPLYLMIILLCIIFVGLALQKTGAESIRPFSLWKIAIWIIFFTTAFNALTSHYGQTVLFTIPGNLPLISGNFTLEAIVYGATNGLILIGMLASFMVLNMALPVRDLISLVPRAFFPVAVVTSIAVTYLPTTLRQFQQVREAQAVRGHQMRSLRDWLPLLMPLLVGGMEHAMQLAEAMTARGFASSGPAAGRRQIYPRIAMLLGVVVLSAGWLMQLSLVSWRGWLWIGAGAILIVGALWSLGRHSHRTTYHRSPWSWMDWISLGISGLLLALCLLPLPGLSHESLNYNPYPNLTMPPFEPVIGVAMMGLLIPGLFVLYNASRSGVQ